MAGADVPLRLDEESLTKEPEQVFDILEKLGEGSYGSVFKGLHKASGKIVAIKQVPIDMQDIVKEISMMQQCDSEFIVKYYGSYLKQPDLWIVIEFCGAGSVADLMRARKLTLTEPQICSILKPTLLGLEYLHSKRKIHRDIKAGNILLNLEGRVKLADFGVAGQLSDTMAKRNTVIGTPFWMAPEVIEEIGYDSRADIWSLGITTIEMAEGHPPHHHIHPMRAIFMIPHNEPPTLEEPDKFSSQLNDFIKQCLVKNFTSRPSATTLLTHAIIQSAKPSPVVLADAIEELLEIKANAGGEEEDDDSGDGQDGDTGTIKANGTSNQDSTMVSSRDVPQPGTIVVNMPLDSTIVVHSDSDDGEESTMQRNASMSGSYQSPFMAYFQKQEEATPSEAALQSVKQLNGMNIEDLKKRYESLESDMQKEIETLKERYAAKRKPILNAIDAKAQQVPS